MTPATVPSETPEAPAATPVAQTKPAVFGPETVQQLTNLAAINLATAVQSALPQSVSDMLRGPDKDSAACAWLEQAGMDFVFVSGYDGFYGMPRDMTTLPRESWEQTDPSQVAGSLHDTGQDVPAKFGDSSRLNNATNFTYGFKTRDGSVGLLQITAFNNNPPGVTIRYKLFQPTTNLTVTAAGQPSDELREKLAVRLEAATSISDVNEKDQALTAIVNDAAKAGEVEITKQALGSIGNQAGRDEATHQAALELAKRGLQKPAVELAREIYNSTTRDQALSELAQ
jgi:hypothetical protein